MIAKGNRQSLVQFIKFNLVGVLNTLVDFALFTLLIYVGMHYLAAQCIAYAGGVTNSYLCNKKWTFSNGSRTTAAQIARFAAVNGVSFALSLVLLYLLGERFGVHPLAAKVGVTAITMIVNFTGTKLWVFRNESRS